MRATACLIACALACTWAADAPSEAMDASPPPQRRAGLGALLQRMRRHRDELRALRKARRAVDVVVARALHRSSPMTREKCQSVADLLQYSFYYDERITFGFCVAYHVWHAVQMSKHDAACGVVSSSVECVPSKA
jgi:hypothetical protein